MAKPYLSLKDVRVYFDPRTQSLRLISKDRRLRRKPFQLNFARDTPSAQSLIEVLRSERLDATLPDPLPARAAFPQNHHPHQGRYEWQISGQSEEGAIRDHRLQFLTGEIEDGTLLIDLGRGAPMTLVAGSPGSGKTEFLRTIARQVLRKEETELWLFGSYSDHWGEYFPLREQDRASLQIEGDLLLLEELKAELERRLRLLSEKRARSWKDTPELRPIFLVVDSVSRLLHPGASQLGQIQSGFARQALESLVRFGRDAGIHSFMASSMVAQDVTGSFRTGFGRRILFAGSSSPEEQTAVLGTAMSQSSSSWTPPGRASLKSYDGPLIPFQGYWNMREEL